MTFNDALNECCLECKKPLNWSGFKDYGYAAKCCGYLYQLEPRVREYDLVMSREDK